MEAPPLPDAMRVPWMRLLMLGLALTGENFEGQLATAGHVAFSWAAGSLSTALQRRVVVPKLVARGQLHPSQLQRAKKLHWPSLLLHSAAAAATAYLLHRADHLRMVCFLGFTTLVLPLFRAVVFPYNALVLPFLGFVLATVWRWEGVQELFVGLLLFQVVPVLQEVAMEATHRRWPAYVVWWAGFLAVTPLFAVAASVYLVPDYFDYVYAHADPRRRTPNAEFGWKAVHALEHVLGIGGELGAEDNPFTVLGLPQSATRAQIKKRWRELSLLYHPDKVGDTAKNREYFLKLKAAVEFVTESDKQHSSLDPDVLRQRLVDLIQKCFRLMPVVAMWVAISVVTVVAGYFRKPQKPDDNEGEGVGGSEGPAENLEEKKGGGFRLGPSFMGSSFFGLGEDPREETVVGTAQPAAAAAAEAAGPAVSISPAAAALAAGGVHTVGGKRVKQRKGHRGGS